MVFPITPSGIAAETQVAAGVVGASKQVAQGAINVGHDLGDITDQVRAVRAWISNRHNWVRVGWFLSGSAMFTVGIILLGERPVAAAAAPVIKGATKAAKVIPK